MRKSSNSSRNALESPQRIKWLAILFLVSLTTSPLSGQQNRRIEYLANHEVKELTNCMWAGSCVDIHSARDTRTDLKYFFKSKNPPAFKRWKRLWLDSPKDRWAPDRPHLWKDPLSPITIYMVYIPDTSDLNSAVLLKTEHEVLTRVYRVLSDGQEIEYRPISERPGQPPRDLVHVSSTRIQKLAGCAWGQTCEFLEINEFFFHSFGRRHGTWSKNPERDIFSRWSSLYMQTNPTTSEEVEIRRFLGMRFMEWRPLKEYSWYHNGRTYAISHPEPSNLEQDLYATMLLEIDDEDRLAAVYKIRKDGSEIEYRPIYGVPELSLRAYRSVQENRDPRSTYYDDSTEIQYSYLSSNQLKREYGVSWASSLEELKKSRLTRNLEQRDPGTFFEQGRWNMPVWGSTARLSKESGSITTEYWGHNDAHYYLLSDAPHSVVRILRFRSPNQDLRSLSAVFEYRKGGVVRIIRPEEQRITKAHHPPSYTYSYERGRRSEQLQWQEPPREFRSDFKEVPSCEYTRPLVVAEPSTFFLTRGRAFSYWRKHIDELQSKSQYIWTDESWVEKDHRFILRRDWCWQSRYSFRENPANPEWQILEYEDEQLVRVYHYDSFWQETIYEPLPVPSLEEFLGESPEKRLRRMTADPELTRQTIAAVQEQYPRPRSQEVQGFLDKAYAIKRIHQIRDGRPEATAEGGDRVPNEPQQATLGFPAHIAVIASVATVFILLLAWLALRWRRKTVERRRMERSRRHQEMGFDDELPRT